MGHFHFKSLFLLSKENQEPNPAVEFSLTRNYEHRDENKPTNQSPGAQTPLKWPHDRLLTNDAAIKSSFTSKLTRLHHILFRRTSQTQLGANETCSVSSEGVWLLLGKYFESVDCAQGALTRNKSNTPDARVQKQLHPGFILFLWVCVLNRLSCKWGGAGLHLVHVSHLLPPLTTGGSSHLMSCALWRRYAKNKDTQMRSVSQVSLFNATLMWLCDWMRPRNIFDFPSGSFPLQHNLM